MELEGVRTSGGGNTQGTLENMIGDAFYINFFSDFYYFISLNVYFHFIKLNAVINTHIHKNNYTYIYTWNKKKIYEKIFYQRYI